jgi:hypothetical protein
MRCVPSVVRGTAIALLCILRVFGVSAVHAEGCQFVLGFATLERMIPQQVGQCLEDEQHNPNNGDGLQHTTGGLIVWRKADNFTAFTDGYRTWVNGPYGIQERLNTQRFRWEANPARLAVVADAQGSNSVPTPSTKWPAYVSAQWGYALQYPPGWYSLPNHGAPDTDKYFSSRAVSSPQQLGPNDAWLTVRVGAMADLAAGCGGPNATYGQIVQRTPTTLGGVATTEYLTNPIPGRQGGAGWFVVASALHGGRCYSLQFIFDSAVSRAQNSHPVDRIISTFKFLG